MCIFKVQLQSKDVDPNTLFTRFKNLKEYELNQLNMLTPYCTFTKLYLRHKSQFLSLKWNFTSVVISYFAWEIWSCLGESISHLDFICSFNVDILQHFCSLLKILNLFLISNLGANFNKLCCIMVFLFFYFIFGFFLQSSYYGIFFYSLIFIWYLTHNTLYNKTSALSFSRRNGGWEKFLSWKKYNPSKVQHHILD